MSYRHFVSILPLLPFALDGCHRTPDAGIEKADGHAAAVAPSGAISAASTQIAADAGAAPAPSSSGGLSLRERLDLGDFSAPPHPPPTTAKEISALHILIAYRGAFNAPPTVTRSKDEARALARHVAQLVSAGADFGETAVKYSDDPSVKQNFGNLGKFSRGQMEKPFSDAAFALIVMEVTLEPVETRLGFHIIRRTE